MDQCDHRGVVLRERLAAVQAAKRDQLQQHDRLRMLLEESQASINVQIGREAELTELIALFETLVEPPRG